MAAKAAPQWVTEDPRNQQIVAYDPATNKTIETAFSGGHNSVKVTLGGQPFTVDFRGKCQRNARGGSRGIFRLPAPPGWPAPPTASGPAAGRGRAPPPPVAPPAIPVIDKALCEELLNLLDQIDKRIADAMAEGSPDSWNFDGVVTPSEVEKLAPVFTAIQRALSDDKIKAKYGFSGGDAKAAWLQLGQPVPHYYASVHGGGQSIWQRKALSVAGLQNLLKHGRSVWKEMATTKFSSCPADYKQQAPEGMRCGPERMKYLTGNAVDLDTVVLRCNDKYALETINAMNLRDGLPIYKDGDAFGESKQAREYVLDVAAPLLEEFCKMFKLHSDELKKKRNVLLDKSAEIRPLKHQWERGTRAVWHYRNDFGTSNSFHVNVPCIPDVFGALIQAPFHTIRAFLMVHDMFEAGYKRTQWLEDFFEDGVADSCFNQKWKAIESFCERLDSLGSISDKIAKVQKDNQAEFLEILDGDEDGKREIELTFKLLSGEQGRDETGKVRPITEEDVTEYLRRSWY